MVFCYINCSELLWEKMVLLIVNFFANLKLKMGNLQSFWDCKNNFLSRERSVFETIEYYFCLLLKITKISLKNKYLGYLQQEENIRKKPQTLQENFWIISYPGIPKTPWCWPAIVTRFFIGGFGHLWATALKNWPPWENPIAW